MRLRALILAILLPLTAAGVARSEPATSPPPSAPTMPVTVEQGLYLIRSSLMTLNDANRSGNYTVLRDLASPSFKARYTAADLAQIFGELRRTNIDLFAAAIIGPQVSVVPYIDPNKMLRIIGLFPTRPLQINFDLTFEDTGGQWRVFGISVTTPKAPEAPAATETPPAAKQPPQKRKAPAAKAPAK